MVDILSCPAQPQTGTPHPSKSTPHHRDCHVWILFRAEARFLGVKTPTIQVAVGGWRLASGIRQSRSKRFSYADIVAFILSLFSTETVGKVPYPAYPGYIPGVFHTTVRVGIVGMASENT